MLDQLIQIDRAVFFFINRSLANPITDVVMPIFTSDWNLRILYVIIVLTLLWKGDRRLRWMVLFSILTLALTDQVSSMFLKNWIGRPRPCHTLTGIHLLVDCGAGKSMPSSHAANCFGQAVLFAWFYVRPRWWIIGFAAIVSLSRIFVGVHYPSDVLAGAVVGTMIAVAIALAVKNLPISKAAPKNTP